MVVNYLKYCTNSVLVGLGEAIEIFQSGHRTYLVQEEAGMILIES